MLRDAYQLISFAYNSHMGHRPGKKGWLVMVKFRNKGGETVKAGAYWNYDTGGKIRLEKNGVLPGTSSQSYWKVPPAVLPMLGLVLVGIAPPYLSGLYAAYTEKLVTAYISIGNLFIVAVLGAVAIAAYRDRFALIRNTKTFRFRPDGPATETEELAPVKAGSTRINEK